MEGFCLYKGNVTGEQHLWRLLPSYVWSAWTLPDPILLYLRRTNSGIKPKHSKVCVKKTLVVAFQRIGGVAECGYKSR